MTTRKAKIKHTIIAALVAATFPYGLGNLAHAGDAAANPDNWPEYHRD